jgi:hypothetical protein
MDWKRVEDMNDQELLALTEEDVERMVKLLMAEEGIPIYPDLEKPTYEKVEPPDGEFFKFRLFEDIAFPTAEGILKVIKLMQDLGCERYVKEYNDPNGRHEPNILKARYGDEDEFDISSEKLYGAETYKKSKAVLEENKRRKKEYETELKTVQSSRNAAQSFRDEIWKPVREARKRERECELAEVQFAEYLNLANGDVVQAWIFYEKAYKPDEHVECFLREKHEVPMIEVQPVKEGEDQ